LQGDSLTKLKEMEPDSVDLIVTDPPYALTSGSYNENHKGGFMNKTWDAKLVHVETWKECLRVLKPGAFAFVMSSPRQDVLSRMIVRLEDAGFETAFSSLIHTFASGFPKAANISKLVHKRNGDGKALEGAYAGAQFKPAVEIILVVMKPLSEKSYVDQALANGKGCTWLDNCRIPYQSEDDPGTRQSFTRGAFPHADKDGGRPWIERRIVDGKAVNEYESNQKGRFPANLLVSDDVLNYSTIYSSGRFAPHHVLDSPTTTNTYGKYKRLEVDKQKTYGDSGSYSRYFDLDKWFDTTFPFLIIPKASKKEKDMGLDKWIPQTVNDGRQTPIDNPFQRGETPRHNTHPTTKPLKLMSYLIMLGSREGDLVLDPFAGSGTTCIAAEMLKRRWIGIELNAEYCEIAQARLSALPQAMTQFTP
jgi:DNA modification methylase